MIVILSAPIQSGKTTSLIRWSANRSDVYGILTPLVNGKRVFMNAQTREQFAMEATENEPFLSIGKFLFSKTNFNKAIHIIQEGMLKKGWLVIDEIGPLELSGKGFNTILNKVLSIRNDKILLVVREGMTDQIINHFKIKNVEIINTISF